MPAVGSVWHLGPQSSHIDAERAIDERYQGGPVIRAVEGVFAQQILLRLCPKRNSDAPHPCNSTILRLIVRKAERVGGATKENANKGKGL